MPVDTQFYLYGLHYILFVAIYMVCGIYMYTTPMALCSQRAYIACWAGWTGENIVTTTNGYG